MDSIQTIKKQMRQWLRPIPHLPSDLASWLAHNAWWVTLIGVVLGALSVIGTINALEGAAHYFGFRVPVSSLLLASVWVWIVMYAIVLVLAARAVTPLKALQLRGWDLMFTAAVIVAVGGVISNFIKFDLGGVLSSFGGFILGTYVLLEIEKYFTKKKKSKS